MPKKHVHQSITSFAHIDQIDLPMPSATPKHWRAIPNLSLSATQAAAPNECRTLHTNVFRKVFEKNSSPHTKIAFCVRWILLSKTGYIFFFPASPGMLARRGQPTTNPRPGCDSSSRVTLRKLKTADFRRFTVGTFGRFLLETYEF